jgi:hypothetical protein
MGDLEQRPSSSNISAAALHARRATIGNASGLRTHWRDIALERNQEFLNNYILYNHTEPQRNYYSEIP